MIAILLLIIVLGAMYTLLSFGGCNCHQIENGHRDPTMGWKRLW